MRQSVAVAASATAADFQVGCIRKLVCEWDALLRKHCLPPSVCLFMCTVVGLKAILRNMHIIWIHITSESSACQ